MADTLWILAGAVFGGVLGAQITAAWIELRHDCMPHDRERCREDRKEGEPRG